MDIVDRQIDAIDQKLLACLRENARTPLTSLAKIVGLSRGAAQDRLRRLERDGVIVGYTVRLRSGSAPSRAWLTIGLAPGVNCAVIAPHLVRMTEVVACYSLAGPIDIVSLVEAANAVALSDVRERVAQIPGVSTVQTFPVLVEHLG